MKTARIDWEQVRARLRASEAALNDSLVPSQERIETAYRRRAVRLASGSAKVQQVSPGLRTLAFRLGRERYAIELEHLAEVLPFTTCTAVPGAPPRSLGVISVRGELRAVLDLGLMLGLPHEGTHAGGFVLMLRAHGQLVGLKIDEIEEFREIRGEDLVRSGQGSYVKGLAADTLLLDTGALLGGLFTNEEL